MNLEQEWLLKAERDLKGSKTLFEDNYFDLCVYHVQQCAEKALKGYLIWQRHELLKTHNLKLLNNVCESYDATFSGLTDIIDSLNGFDTRFRYPDVVFEPPKEAAQEAIDSAEEVLNFVKNKISPPSV